MPNKFVDTAGLTHVFSKVNALVERTKTIGSNSSISDYVSWVIPLISLDDSDTTNTYATGDIFLKRLNGAGGRMTRISVSCCKMYGDAIPYYAMSYDGVPSGNGVKLLPRTFTYNGVKWFGIYGIITSAAFNGTRWFIGKANRFDDIDMIAVYNTNTATVINEEIYNSLADEGICLSRGLTGEPFVAGADGERYKLYHEGNMIAPDSVYQLGSLYEGDMNELVMPGQYRVNRNTNLPEDAYYGQAFVGRGDVEGANNDTVFQIVGSYNKMKMLYRGGVYRDEDAVWVWEEWSEVYSTLNKPTPAAIGAAPAYTYGTEDITAGTTALETGKLYLQYE